MSGYEGFAPVYDAWAADMTEDIDFYVDLAREADGPVIELAAGTGRISIPNEADMRDLDFDAATDLVICPYRALLHLPTWSDRRRVFERVARALRPGGRFAWNAFVFDHRYAMEYDGRWQDEPLRHLTTYAPGDNRVDITLEDGPTLSLWWIARSEWEALLDVAGLVTEALYGWFDRRPFDDESREFVWVARKPG